MRNSASKEMILDSVEFWDTDVCFLHIQLMETNVRLPKIQKTPPVHSRGWFRVLKVASKVWVLKESQSTMLSSVSPHDNIVGSHLCDECMKSILPIVCRMPGSIMWLLLQVCWPTTKCQVFQFVPTASMSIQIESKLVIILQLIQGLPVWIDDHPSKDLKLCVTAALSCLPARSIVHRIYEHVLPCRRPTQPFLREVFHTLVTFQLLLQKYVIQTSLSAIQ